MPIRRRIASSLSPDRPVVSSPNMVIWPALGRRDNNSRRNSEVLPEPDGPVRKWNEPGAMAKLRFLRTGGPSP